MQIKIKDKTSISDSIFCVLLVLVFPSPIISSTTGIPHSFLMITLGILLFSWNLIHGINKSIAALSLFIVTWGLLNSLLAHSKSQFGISILTASALTIAGFIKNTITEERSIATLNKFMIVILIGAWISIVYFLLNGSPILTIENPDGRENNLFLTSLSNSSDYEFWEIIRPSGIYDEPGALSFCVIIIVILNELHNPRNKNSLMMMLLGLVTLSVAHAIMTTIYLIYYMFKFNWRFRMTILLISLISIFTIINIMPSDTVIATNFINRFTIEDGRLRGDNRSNQVETFFRIIENDIDITTRGHQAITNDSSTKRYSEDQSSNPFSMWFNYGLLTWMTYFFAMLYILHLTFKNIKISNIFISGVLLFILLLQRPYISDPGWGITVWLSILLIYRTGNHKIKATDKQNPRRN